MVTRIVASVRRGTARIALLNGDILTEYALWILKTRTVWGIFMSAVSRRAFAAMAGSFVDLHDVTGFLPDSAAGAAFSEGAYLTVTITRAAQGGKGPRLAVAEPGAVQPATIQTPVSSAAAQVRCSNSPHVFPAAAIAIDDYAVLAALHPALGDRIAYRPVTFDSVLEDEVAALAESTSVLPGGALMHITPTPALTAIDVDAGAATAAATPKAYAQLALNTTLIPALARQIVLRNLSGAILIDFAGMRPRARAQLTAPLNAALAADPLKSRLHGFTTLGFAEISRPRIRPPLHELPTP